MVPLPFTGTKCQPHFDISRTARIHTVPMLICCNISRCNRRTCRNLSVNFKQFSPATPKPSSIYIRPFPLSLIPIRYFSFCDTGFLIKIPDSQHLFRKYRNFSVKFQQMYSLFHSAFLIFAVSLKNSFRSESASCCSTHLVITAVSAQLFYSLPFCL